MDRKKPRAIFLLCIFIFFSCAAQDNIISFPPPNKSLYENDKSIEIGNITESRDMDKGPKLPDWLSAFLGGGIEEAEKLEAYANRYLFIAVNEGVNFAALSRWADSFSVEHDFSMLAATRIEKRMNVSNSVYPDEEFGLFNEMFVKNAYSGEYPGAVKEDTYWIKTKVPGDNNEGELSNIVGLSDNAVSDNAALPEVFVFYVLISVNADEMRDLVYNFFTQALSSSAPTRAQTAAINRLGQNFFEGF